MTALLCLLAAVAGGRAEIADLPPRRAGDVEAHLRIDVPEEGIAPGQARLRYTLTFAGPEGLQMQPPRLEHAYAGWRIAARASSWRRDGDGAHCTLTLHLEQFKPGDIPPPGVVVPVRAGQDTAWQEVAWMRPLREPRDVAPPDTLPPLPRSAWPARLRWAAVVLACLLLAALLGRAVQRRRRRRAAQPAHVVALARLEEAALPPADRPAERFGHAETVVREYLDARLGLKTLQQTTREVLAACRDLPAEARAALEELLRRGELVKFAGQVPTLQECATAVDLARRVIGACAAAPVPVAEAAPAGEQGKAAEPG
jgi:hypothetical protein